VLRGHWQPDAALEAAEVGELEVHSRRQRLWVATDGENRLLKVPLRFTMKPGALTVLVPERAAGAGTAAAP
jgi:diacylglycerol kinase family enzyme